MASSLVASLASADASVHSKGSLPHSEGSLRTYQLSGHSNLPELALLASTQLAGLQAQMQQQQHQQQTAEASPPQAFSFWPLGPTAQPRETQAHEATGAACDDGTTHAPAQTSTSATISNPPSQSAPAAEAAPETMEQDGVSSVWWSFPPSASPSPPGRWAHSACCYSRNLVLVFGGIGHSMMDDLWALDTQTLLWRPLKPSVASPKDRPEKTLSHAVACVDRQMWLFGGQQGRTFVRHLFVLDVERSTWSRLAPSDAMPAARAGHAMVAVGSSIYLFGGQGKKYMNDLWVLDTATSTFREVIKPAGRPPLPRRGMSCVYNGRDSLIIFGGSHSSGVDNSLSVYDLQRNEWYQPRELGTVPSPRTNHAAAMLDPNHMIVFGGCSASGTFFNDTFILDTSTFTWSKPQCLNAAPAPRYHHSLVCVEDGKALLYGGINAKQVFDGVVVLHTKFAPEISHIAEELQSMVSSSGHVTPESVRSQTSTRDMDLMRVQLTDLLVRRNIEELHAQTSSKAQEKEDELQREREALQAERRHVAQLRVMLEEAEQERKLARKQAKEAELKLARDAAALAETKGALDAASAVLAQRGAEADATARQNQGLVKEMGVLASRYAQLQQKAKASSSDKGKRRSPYPAAPGSTSSLTGGAGSSSMAGLGGAESVSGTDGFHSNNSLGIAGMFERGMDRDSLADESLMSSYECSYSGGVLRAAGAEVHGVDEGCEDPFRAFLEREAAAPRPAVPMTAFQEAMLAASNPEARRPPAADSSSLELAEARRAQAACQEQIAALVARMDQMQSQVRGLEEQLSQLKGEPSALEKLSLAGLQEVEQKLDDALRSTREAVLLRRIAEVERRTVTEQNFCSLCLERPRGVVFNCGHQSCNRCSEKLPACPFCRVAITARIKIFDS